MVSAKQCASCLVLQSLEYAATKTLQEWLKSEREGKRNEMNVLQSESVKSSVPYDMM
jgi:hypothetical protein